MEEQYDLIVVGGGIHGMLCALHAAERGRRVALLERSRIGGQATGGWFRILHGGLRYLQSLDVPRLRDSVTERRWWMANFPEHVSQMPFLMPLYGRRMKRNEAFLAAFALERVLACDRNHGVPAELRLRPGRVLGREQVVERFPTVPLDGLQGGALWPEAIVPDTDALMAALQARISDAGGELKEGVEAIGLESDAGAVRAVVGRLGDGSEIRLPSSRVIVAAGSWTDDVLGKFGVQTSPLGWPVLGFNLLIDRPPPADVGLSLTGAGSQSDMIFAYPRDGRMFVGTRYLLLDGLDNAQVPGSAIAGLLDEVNGVMPDLDLTPDDVVEVTSGFLPGCRQGSLDLAKRDVIRDHARHGGPKGLVSLWGIKYTTAGRVARDALKAAGL